MSQTKRRLLTLAVLVALGPVLAGTAPAHADGEPCMPSTVTLERPTAWYAVRDVNSNLQVAGQISLGGMPVMWDATGASSLVELPRPFFDILVKGMNEQGDIIGDGYLPDREPKKSWIYTASDELLMLRPTRPERSTSTYGINSERVVVGRQDGFPIIWRDPASRADWLEVPPRAMEGSAGFVDPAGRAWGYLQTPKGQFHVQWSRTGRIRSQQRVPDGFFTVNRPLRAFAGPYAAGNMLVDSEVRPALFGPDGLTMIDVPNDAIFGEAAAVSRSGYVVGTVLFSDGHQQGFLSTPTGEMVLLSDSLVTLAVADAHSLTLIDVETAESPYRLHTCASSYLPQ